jgi:hypothetical protein
MIGWRRAQAPQSTELGTFVPSAAARLSFTAATGFSATVEEFVTFGSSGPARLRCIVEARPLVVTVGSSDWEDRYGALGSELGFGDHRTG